MSRRETLLVGLHGATTGLCGSVAIMSWQHHPGILWLCGLVWVFVSVLVAVGLKGGNRP